MKKICYFINTDWYFDLHWLERADHARVNGYEVHIISDFKSSQIYNKFINRGFICHRVDSKSQSLNPLTFLWAMLRTYNVFNRIQPDIIHAATIKPCIYSGFYSFISKTKLVLSIVGLGRFFTSQSRILSFARIVLLPFYKVLLTNKKLFVIFEHESDRENFISITGIDDRRTIVIDGAGIDTNLFSYNDEVENKLPIVLFAARLLKRKGLSDLVTAKKSLTKKGVIFDIHVAGIQVIDSDAIPLEDIKQWESEGLIKWLGNVTDMKTVIAQANIVALPSTYAEGVPRILIESASVGRALIAYDSGGCRSIVKDDRNGYLVEKGNVESFTHKLEKLILEKERRKDMAEYGRKLVLKKFDSTLILSQTLEIYDSIYNS